MIFRAVEDADLIERTRKGDVEAYNLLISRWEKRVYNYLLRILNSREDALDLCQDVFLKGYQNIRRLDDPARFGPWIFRIAHNEAFSFFRRKRPEDELTGIESPSEPAYPVELTLAAAAALEKLSSEQRETVVLKIYQGFKFEEIAEILNCPVSTVKSRLYSALEILKNRLAPVSTRGVT